MQSKKRTFEEINWSNAFEEFNKIDKINIKPEYVVSQQLNISNCEAPENMFFAKNNEAYIINRKNYKWFLLYADIADKYEYTGENRDRNYYILKHIINDIGYIYLLKTIGTSYTLRLIKSRITYESKKSDINIYMGHKPFNSDIYLSCYFDMPEMKIVSEEPSTVRSYFKYEYGRVKKTTYIKVYENNKITKYESKHIHRENTGEIFEYKCLNVKNFTYKEITALKYKKEKYTNAVIKFPNKGIEIVSDFKYIIYREVSGGVSYFFLQKTEEKIYKSYLILAKIFYEKKSYNFDTLSKFNLALKKPLKYLDLYYEIIFLEEEAIAYTSTYIYMSDGKQLIYKIFVEGKYMVYKMNKRNIY